VAAGRLDGRRRFSVPFFATVTVGKKAVSRIFLQTPAHGIRWPQFLMQLAVEPFIGQKNCRAL
jgi:hypothetical protein